VLFDENMNLVPGGSGAIQISSVNTSWQNLPVQKITIPQNGFLRAFSSNTSTADIRINNFQVTHMQGVLQEEYNYYPYGLIFDQSHALTGTIVPTNYLYNGKELQQNEFGDGGNGLELYDYGARMYDVQIGRWTAVDPLSDKYHDKSPYCYVTDNPINRIDPNGMEIKQIEGGVTITGEDAKNAVVAIQELFGGDDKKKTGDDKKDDSKKQNNSNGDPKESVNWYDPAGKGNLTISFGGAISEGLGGAFRLTRGLSTGSKFSPKFYPSGWGGGSRAMIKTYNLGKIGGALGQLSFGIGLVIDGIGVYNYYYNQNSSNVVHPAKAALNTGFGLFALSGYGTIPALLYFGVDAFYPGGWKGYGNDYDRLQKENAKIIPGFITAPYGALKQ
jgi:RHS repeat-associated protein